MMAEPIDIEIVGNGKPYGDDIVLRKGDKELQIPYGDEQDRDVTIKYFNDFVKPDYEVRWLLKALETIRSDLPCFQGQNGPI